MAGEANELMELLNCVRQFELDIKNENDEVGVLYTSEFVF